jgi:hypothetical protein
MFGGEAALPGAILMAHYGRIEVISIDYRMPPDYPFPAALDDSVSVWKDVPSGKKCWLVWHLSRRGFWFSRLFLSWCIKDFSSSEI